MIVNKYILEHGKSKSWFFVYCTCHEALQLGCIQAIEEARHLYKQCLYHHGPSSVAVDSFGVFKSIEETNEVTENKVKMLKKAFNKDSGGIYGLVYRLQKASKDNAGN